jgi:hypothetical protein
VNEYTKVLRKENAIEDRERAKDNKLKLHKNKIELE